MIINNNLNGDKMLEFIKVNDLLLLKYTSENGVEWLEKKLNDLNHNLKRTFLINKKDIYYEEVDEDEYEENIKFIIAKLVGEYYKFDKNILGIKFNLYFEKDIEFNQEMFIKRNQSIFRLLNHIFNENNLFIGNNKGDFPLCSFYEIINNLPKDYEIQLYIKSRISDILREYFGSSKDFKIQYDNYRNVNNLTIQQTDIFETFKNLELNKYKKILEKLKFMLKHEDSYNENQWHQEIIQIIKLLYPQYIKALNKVKFPDVYKKSYKEIDILLVNHLGYVDVCEIKKPDGYNLVSSGLYRNNYIPVRELSGTIMQVENYIYLLSKSGIEGEKKLNERYRFSNIELSIVNPKGLIIMGREKNLNQKQKQDLEIIKKKYSNIIDIMTYDDLIVRVENTITQYEFS